MELVPGLVNIVNNRKGKDNAITAKELCGQVAKHTSQTLTGPRCRAIIHYIRINDLVPMLVASGKGYHVSQDLHECKRYIETLQQRAAAIHSIQAALARQVEAVTGVSQKKLF